MPYTYALEDRIVHIAWSGVISKEDLRAIGRDLPRIAAENGFAPDVLHTFDGVTGYDFPPIAAYMLSLLRKRVEIPTPVRSASVARTPEARAVAKMFAALNRNQNLEMKVFDDEVDARRWIARAGTDEDEETFPRQPPGP